MYSTLEEFSWLWQTIFAIITPSPFIYRKNFLNLRNVNYFLIYKDNILTVKDFLEITEKLERGALSAN